VAVVSLSISIFALLFTLTTFWWLHARRGRLVAGWRYTWAGSGTVRWRRRAQVSLAMRLSVTAWCQRSRSFRSTIGWLFRLRFQLPKAHGFLQNSVIK